MEVLISLLAKTRYDPVVGSLWHSKIDGYTLVPSGKREMSVSEINSLPRILKRPVKLSYEEIDNLRDLFPKYELVFTDKYWVGMTLRPEHYPLLKQNL